MSERSYETITLEAAEWLLELQKREVDVERISAWQAWLMADPRHKEAFDRLQLVQECIDRIQSPPWPTDSEVAEDVSDMEASPAAWSGRWRMGTDSARELEDDIGAAELTASSTMRRVPRRRYAVAALAAGLLAAATGLLALTDYRNFEWSKLAAWGDTVLETQVGELRRVQLADGSTVTLGGHTRLVVDIDDRARTIELDRGEAFFEVARDESRPFVVHAGEAAIRAVGTAFDVRRVGEQVSVAVAEGVVEVAGIGLPKEAPAAPSTSTMHAAQMPTPGRQAPPSPDAAASGSAAVSPSASPTPPGVVRLTAGQRIHVEPSQAHVPEPTPVDTEAIAAWRSGRRQYLAEPLGNVVADLNRYTSRRIVITDPAVSELAITGSVFERDIGRWLESLETALPVRVHEEADGTVTISAR